MSKRKRFIATSLSLSFGFIAIQLLGDRYRFYSISVLSLMSVLLFIWSLRESLRKNMTLLTLILPFYFTYSVGLFWFLLPSSLFAQIPIVIFFAFGIYSLCLTANIYTVAAIRTIALMRAARGVGFVLTLVTFFLVFDAVLSLRASIVIAAALTALLSFPLFLQGYWAVNLGNRLAKNEVLMSFISSLIVGELAIGLFFWPVKVVVGSLFLTAACYLLLGLGQAKLEDRLFSQTVREYLVMGVLVFLGMFLATRWGG